MQKMIYMLAVLVILLVTGTVMGGVVGGPRSTKDVVQPRSSDNYNLLFRGQEVARVLVSGDGSTDLDCFVYDASGHLITSDTGETDDCALVWVPIWTGVFRIVVSNLGWESNIYIAVTN